MVEPNELLLVFLSVDMIIVSSGREESRSEMASQPFMSLASLDFVLTFPVVFVSENPQIVCTATLNP